MNNKSIKILYIHHGSVIGGAPTSLKNLVKGIIQNNPKAKITVACIYSSMIPFFQEIIGIKVKSYVFTDTLLGRYLMGWSRLTLRGIFSLIITAFTSLPSIYAQVRYIKSESPDIIHLNSSILWSAGIAGKLCDIPVIWHVREASDDSKYNLIRIMYSKFVAMLSAKVICIGPQEYKKMGGQCLNNVVKIYNSLDDSYFEEYECDKRYFRKKLGLLTDQFFYLSLGGNSFRKGPYQLIEALRCLDDDYACVLAGQPPVVMDSEPGLPARLILKIEDKLFENGIKKKFIWEYAHRLSLSMKDADKQKLFLPGELDDVKPYIKACDVLIFAGTTPHSARPVYEAWALKKPVIVFDSEVMQMDIEDGVDGLIVKEHTAKALAEAIIYLKHNPDICRQMGENGFKKAVKRFSLKKNTVKIVDIYSNVLNEHSL